MEWDGTDEMGRVMERGLYAYDLVGWDTVPGCGGDMNQKVSSHLFIDAGTDEEGNPITEAEFLGTDTTGDTLYYRKQYRLRETQVPLDNDGDEWENEDPVDGVDNDGDGLVDEDPEDYQPLRNAQEGKITLYDPDLQNVKEWAISSLWCEVHNDYEGLTTSTDGKQHSFKVDVPAPMMGKSGVYRFVVSVKDKHADREKGHRQKWALERNTEYDSIPIEWLPGDGFGGTSWQGIWVKVKQISGDPNKRSVKTAYIDPIVTVRHYIWMQVLEAPKKGTIRGGTNGTFFDHQNPPYPLVGHVGVDGSWIGNNVQYKRWAFGIDRGGPSFAHARMTASDSLYTVPPNIKALPYGLSGIGCLIDDGRNILTTDEALEGFRDELEADRARTLVAWTERGDHFFMIMSNQSLYVEGWTWTEASDLIISPSIWRIARRGNTRKVR